MESIVKHYGLFEKMIRKLKLEKIRNKPVEEIEAPTHKQLVNKHKTEKILRKEVLELEEEANKIRDKKDLLEKMKKNDEEKQQAKIKKKEQLELLQHKTKIRQEEMLKQRLNISETSPLKLKPKYLEMEENYKMSFEIPEIERSKAELAKKKMFFQPIIRDDWVLHAKKYNETIQEAKKKRISKLIEYQIENNFNEINYFKKIENLEQEEAKNLKKVLRERRKNYGELVRELFGPKVNLKSSVAQEIEKKKIEPQNFLKETELKSLVGPVSANNPKKKKSKKFKAPKTPEIKSIQKLDYLSELRNNRNLLIEHYHNEESVSLDNALAHIPYEPDRGNKSEILKKIQHLEKIANKEEHKMKLIDPNSRKGLEMEEKINELLMQSIRAKANMLT